GLLALSMSLVAIHEVTETKSAIAIPSLKKSLSRFTNSIKGDPDNADLPRPDPPPGYREPQELSPEKAKKILKHTKLGDMFFERKDFTNALLEYQTLAEIDKQNFK